MEPIFEHPFFAQLLCLWRFATNYHQYLELENNISKMSLYELAKHIQLEKYRSIFTETLIVSLVRKVSMTLNQINKNKVTSLLIAAHNKYKFFEELLQLSAFQLGSEIVNYSLESRNKKTIQNVQNFQELKVEEKYTFLSTLVDLIQISDDFEQNCLKKIKQNHTKRKQEEKDKVKLRIHQEQNFKMLNSMIFLGIDINQRSFYFVPSISDRILHFDSVKNKWNSINSEQVRFLMAYLIKKQETLNFNEIILLSNLTEIYSKIDKSQLITAFDRLSLVKNVSFKHQQKDKIKIIKQKMVNLELQYSKFLGDCYNFRWACKTRRLQYHKQISQTEELIDLLIILSQFFNETKHKTEKSVNTLKIYDYSLDTTDCEQSQFKDMFLRMNYLYNQTVFKINKNDKEFSEKLYGYIKSFLSNQQCPPYCYQYMYVFIESMTKIVEKLYPSCHSKRIKNLTSEVAKNQQKKIELLENKKIGKLKKFEKLSDEEEDNQEDSQKTVEMRSNTKNLQSGRRLRNKVKVFYGTSNNSSIVPNSKVTKKVQPSMKLRNNKPKSKMNIDSESDQSEQSYQDSQKNEQSIGLNLDTYKYEQPTSVQKFGRQLRSRAN